MFRVSAAKLKIMGRWTGSKLCILRRSSGSEINSNVFHYNVNVTLHREIHFMLHVSPGSWLKRVSVSGELSISQHKNKHKGRLSNV